MQSQRNDNPVTSTLLAILVGVVIIIGAMLWLHFRDEARRDSDQYRRCLHSLTDEELYSEADDLCG